MEVSSIKTVFFKYILMPLMMLVLIFIMNLIRKNKPAIKLKHIIIYVLLGGLSLSVLGFFGFAQNTFNPYWYLISQVIFLCLGIIHVNLLHRYFRQHIKSLGMSILFESILTLTCILFGGFLYVLIFRWISMGLGNEYWSASSMLAFTIPLIFYYCYIQFISIPFDIYKTWQFDPDKKPFNFEGVDFDRLMVLNVELSKKVEDSQRFLIKAKTLPTGVSFGDWFYRVVDYYNHKNPNGTIDLIDSGNEPYYWIFYVKKSFFSMRKYIDFENDITANTITENQVIICKRVIRHQEEGRVNNIS